MKERCVEVFRKIFVINCQLRNKIFIIVIYRFSLVKAAMNASHLYKSCKDCLTDTGHGAMVFTKRLSFLIFLLPRAYKDHGAPPPRIGRIDRIDRIDPH